MLGSLSFLRTTGLPCPSLGPGTVWLGEEVFTRVGRGGFLEEGSLDPGSYERRRAWPHLDCRGLQGPAGLLRTQEVTCPLGSGPAGGVVGTSGGTVVASPKPTGDSSSVGGERCQQLLRGSNPGARWILLTPSPSCSLGASVSPTVKWGEETRLGFPGVGPWVSLHQSQQDACDKQPGPLLPPDSRVGRRQLCVP